MIEQPNFQKLFFDSLGGDKPRKITYQVRNDSNQIHDMHFLGSLVHDSRFKRKDIKISNKKLTIPIERDCWELKSIQHSDTSGELYITSSMISISPINRIEWTFDNEIEFDVNTELWIQSIKLLRSEHIEYIVLIEGFGWECNIHLIPEELNIELNDQKVPSLYSQLKKNL